MNEKHFWFYLLNVSESIGAIDPADDAAFAQLEDQLDSLNEIFRGSVDPVEEFEKYTLLNFCNSIRKLLAARRRSARAAAAPRQQTHRGTP